MTKKDIREISKGELETFFLKNHLEKFRINQINEWLWEKGSNSFDEMSSLSKNIRTLLNEKFEIKSANIDQTFISKDGSIKYSFRLHDNNLIEGVLIPSKKRVTACISSQVGCSLDCSFCATGGMRLSRNLTHYEMFDQVYKLNQESIKHYGKKLTNIVFMGMGEPLFNYNNLLQSINIITSKKGLKISPKRITVSTVGLSKMIMKLADDNIKFNLAISLHSAIDVVRSNIMSINKSNDLSELKKSIQYFYNKTSRRITYEYILFKNLNDSIEDAKQLSQLCKISPCKINLIEYNTVKNLDFEKSSKENTRSFINFLESKNIIVNLRKSKGKDINAACGQLVNKMC